MQQKQTLPVTSNIGPPVSDPRQAILLRLGQHYLKSISTVFEQSNIWANSQKGFGLAPRYVGIGLRLHHAPDLKKAMLLVPEIGHAAGIGDGSATPPITAVLVGNLLVYQIMLPEYIRVSSRRRIKLWQDVSIAHPKLQNGAGVGLGMLDKPVPFRFTDTGAHALVCGVTGSGKTELMKTIIYQLMQAPIENVGLAIVSPKPIDYERFSNAEHLLWQPASTSNDIHNLIQHFHAEFLRREHNSLCNNRRHVLVLDEADQDSVLRDSENRERINNIALRGRAFRMNLLVGTHVPDKASIGNIISSLTNRFLGMMSNARESGQVEGGLALHKLAGQGDFWHVMGQNQTRFQVAKLERGDFDNMRLAPVPQVPPVEAELPSDWDIPTERKEPHRPRILPDPKSVAYYIYHSAKSVTQAEALKKLDLSRTGHHVNRDFTLDVEREFRVLRLADRRHT